MRDPSGARSFKHDLSTASLCFEGEMGEGQGTNDMSGGDGRCYPEEELGVEGTMLEPASYLVQGGQRRSRPAGDMPDPRPGPWLW